MELRTALTAPQVATIFRDTLAETSRRVEFGDIKGDSSPFAQFEDQPEFSAVASVFGKVNPLNNFALQIYVFDEGDCRKVQLVVVGSSFFGRALHGAKYTYSKSVGWKQARHVLERLRSTDPNLKVLN
jgi:hypothetical protein